MKRFLALATVLFTATTTWAWGEAGHQVVGELAERHLCHKAQLSIRQILNGETLARASTWADEIRSDHSYDHIKPWHYVTIPSGYDYESAPKNPDGDVVRALGEQLKILNGKGESKASRVQALRLIVHFVGDIHQPLHAGLDTDRGGNEVRVNFFGKASNLHSVWDSGLIGRLNLSSEELADLLDQPQPDYPAIVMSPVAEWANESSKLLPNAYEFGAQIYVAAPPRLAQAYFNRNIGTVKQRLWQAGMRLGKTLNKAFGCSETHEL